MGSSLVVVLKPGSQGALEVATIEDQQPVETFAPSRANLALDVGIGQGRRYRRPNHGHAICFEDKVGATSVLVVVVVDQEPRLDSNLIQLPADIPRLLPHPAGVRMLGHSEPNDPPRRQLHI
jgi:hypothetical protein